MCLAWDMAEMKNGPPLPLQVTNKATFCVDVSG